MRDHVVDDKFGITSYYVYNYQEFMRHLNSGMEVKTTWERVFPRFASVLAAVMIVLMRF